MLSNETFWVIFKHCFVGFFIFYEHWYIQKHFLPQKFCALLSLIANALDIRPCSARRPSFFRCLFCVVVLTVILRMADFVNPSNNWMNGLSRADWQSKPAVRWICRISPWTSKIARSTLAVVSWHIKHHSPYLLPSFITVGYSESDVLYRWTKGRGVNIASDMKLSQFDLIQTPTGNATTIVNKGWFLF